MKKITIGSLMLAVSLGSFSVFGFTGPTKSPDSSGPKHKKASGPIVVNWKIKPKHEAPVYFHGVKYEPVEQDSDMNLTVNPDGSWNFSGQFPSKNGKEIDAVIGLRAKDGSIVLFHYAGKLSNGGNNWDKTGQSDTLKEGFTSFQDYSWDGSFRITDDSEGLALKYEKRKEKEEKEKNSHLQKELEKEKREIAEEVARQRQDQSQPSGTPPSSPPPSSSGGSSVLGDVTNTLGDVVGGVASTAGDVVSGIGSFLKGIF